MNNRHLDGDELDRLLAGEALSESAEQHLQSCLVCRRRRDAFLAAVAGARRPDPSQEALAAVRAAALASLPAAETVSRRSTWRWVAATAAAVILVVITSLLSLPSPTPDFNADAVLAEVDEMLANDPLTWIASEEVLEMVLAEDEHPEDGNTS